MARKEKPVGPGLGPLAEFARDLRALRADAGGATYRALAKRAGYSASTLSVAASGTMLPSLEVTLAYVQACGGDPEAWRARWHQVAQQLLRPVNDAPPIPPDTSVGLSVDRSRLGVSSPVDGAGARPRRRTLALIVSVIALLVVALLCSGALWLANASRAQPIASSGPSTVPVARTSPNIAVNTAAPVEESSCDATGLPAPTGSAIPAALPGDVQQLPAELGSMSLAGGPLMRATFGSELSGSPAVTAVLGSLADVTGAGYIDPTETDNGGEPFMYLTIGTPKPGQCWELLAYDTLAIAAGTGDVGNISTVAPGPHLASAHAVLACGQVMMVTDICAWAGPGPAGGKPVFGLLRVIPTITATARLEKGDMPMFADQVYAALTAKH